METTQLNENINLFVGTDHGGFAIKEALHPWLEELVSEQILAKVHDCGAYEHDPADDFPEFGKKVAQEISAAKEDGSTDPHTLGLLLCRSGGGMAIVANRFPFVRAVVCRSKEDVVYAREHDNCNVLVLEGDQVSVDEAKDFFRAFFATPFEEARHIRRVLQIDS